MSRTSEKTFDCVAFKRKVQKQVFEETKGMSHKEEIEYFQREARKGRVGKWWRKIQRQTRASF